MAWVVGALILFAVAAGLRGVLRLDREPSGRTKGPVPLAPDCEAVYQPVAMEVETQGAILGISLNDAFEERDFGHQEIAWRLVRLSVGEWDRLAELLAALLKAVVKHMPAAQVVVPVRGIVADRFKSEPMMDHARMYEFMDQLVFSSRLRFQLHIRFLRRATEILTAEFRRSYRYGDQTEDRHEELWQRLDLYFHDFDLISKEALLALRALLICLPSVSLSGMASDAKDIVGHGVRSTSLPVDQ